MTTETKKPSVKLAEETNNALSRVEQVLVDCADSQHADIQQMKKQLDSHATLLEGLAIPGGVRRPTPPDSPPADPLNTPLQALVDTVTARAGKEAAEARGQFTLGELIEALGKCEDDDDVCFEFGHFSVGKVDSYRGDYSQLAIDVDTTSTINVKHFLGRLKEILGTTLEGYKGGDYMMTDSTPIWVASWGETSDTFVVGLRRETYGVAYLETHTERDQ